jgi:hypothetical protein
MSSLQIASRRRKPASINDADRKRECGLFGEHYGLHAGNLEAFAATHILTGHKIIFAQHVGARFGETGAIALVSTSCKLSFLGANDPRDLVFRSLMAMWTVQHGHFLFRPFVKEFFFVHGSFVDYCILRAMSPNQTEYRVKLSLD